MGNRILIIISFLIILSSCKSSNENIAASIEMTKEAINGLADENITEDTKPLTTGDTNLSNLFDFEEKEGFVESNLIGYGRIREISQSPLGSKLAVTSTTGIYIYDFDTLEEISFLRGHIDSINGIDWSPNGEKLSSVSDDGSIKIWNTLNGEILYEYSLVGSKWIKVDWSANESYISALDDRGNIFILDLDANENVNNVSADSKFINISIANNSTLLATISISGFVQVWDFLTGEEILHFENNNVKDDEYKISWIENDRFIFVFSPDKDQVVIIDSVSGLEVIRHEYIENISVNTIMVPWLSIDRKIVGAIDGDEILLGNSSSPFDEPPSAWSNDGVMTASYSHTKGIKIWDTISGKFIRGFARDEYLYVYRGRIFWSPNNEEVVAYASSNNTFIKWNIESREIVNIKNIHENRIILQDIGHNGELIVYASELGDVFVQNVQTNENKIAYSKQEGDKDILSISLSQVDNYLAIGTESGVKIIDLATDNIIADLAYEQSCDRCVPDNVKWSPDGTTIAVVGDNEDNPLVIWSSGNWNQTHLFNLTTNSVTDIAWSPDSKRIVLSNDENSIILKLSDNSKIGIENDNGFIDTPRSVIWGDNNEEEIIIFGDRYGYITIYDINGNLLSGYDSDIGQINDISFSLSNNLLAIASQRNHVSVMDLANGNILYELTGHLSDVKDVIFSDDGLLLFSLSVDGSIIVWDFVGD